MPRNLDDRLAALAAAEPVAALDGLEDQVWAQVQAKKAAAGAGSLSVRVAVTALALAGGLALGALRHSAPSQAHVAELGVLSEDGLLAPSVRLGGGA
jgi:hypothetical protein